MNFIAGTLLIFMEEESAFWILVYIVEDLLQNYFVHCMFFLDPLFAPSNWKYFIAMSGLLADTQVFELLVSQNLPDLYQHFQKVHVSMAIFTTSWFLCLFVNYVPTETCFIVSLYNLKWKKISLIYDRYGTIFFWMVLQ